MTEMIVGTAFQGDTDRTLQRAQFEDYGWAIDYILRSAWRRYKEAEDILGIKSDMPRLPEPLYFDHRTLQAAHDVLAAAFRYLFPELRQQLIDLAGGSEIDRLHREWRAWIQKEVAEILSEGPACRAILKAAVYSSSEAGDEKDDAIERILTRRYFSEVDTRGLGYPLEVG